MRGRKKHTAEKSFSDNNPGGNFFRAAFGKHADPNGIFLLVMEGCALGSVSTQTSATPFMKEHRDHWIARFAQMAAEAVLAHDAQFFRDAAVKVEQYKGGSGTVVDPIRYEIQVRFENLKQKLGRNPTIPELRLEAPNLKRLDQAQMSKTLKQLGLKCTSADLIKGIKVRADRLYSAHGRVPFSKLRDSLQGLRTARDILSCTDDYQLLVFCESAGVQFDPPLDSVRAHHTLFQKLNGCTPSALGLFHQIPEYCRTPLKLRKAQDIISLCAMAGLPLSKGAP